MTPGLTRREEAALGSRKLARASEDAAIARFLAEHGPTLCPAAAVAEGSAEIAERDRALLRATERPWEEVSADWKEGRGYKPVAVRLPLPERISEHVARPLARPPAPAPTPAYVPPPVFEATPVRPPVNLPVPGVNRVVRSVSRHPPIVNRPRDIAAPTLEDPPMEIAFNYEARTVRRPGRPSVHLSVREVEAVAAMVSAGESCVSRATIATAVWGEKQPSVASVDQFMSQLRKALAKGGIRIVNEPGVGWTLAPGALGSSEADDKPVPVSSSGKRAGDVPMNGSKVTPAPAEPVLAAGERCPATLEIEDAIAARALGEATAATCAAMHSAHDAVALDPIVPHAWERGYGEPVMVGLVNGAPRTEEEPSPEWRPADDVAAELGAYVTSFTATAAVEDLAKPGERVDAIPEGVGNHGFFTDAAERDAFAAAWSRAMGGRPPILMIERPPFSWNAAAAHLAAATFGLVAGLAIARGNR